MLQYWLSVFVKGFQDSLSFVQQDVHGILFFILVLVITLWRLYTKHGGLKAAMKEWWKVIGESVVISVVAWCLVLLVHLIFEPYHIQADLLSNRASLQKAYDTELSNHAICRADLQTSKNSVQLLSDRVGSQQQTLNSFQGGFANQQSAVNSCLTTLSSLEKPERTKIQAFRIGAVQEQQNPSVAPHTTTFVIVTNKAITPVRIEAKCAQPIIDMGAGVLGTGTTSTGGWGGPQPDGGYGTSLNSPAWTPEGPLIVHIFSQMPVSSCSFVEQ